MALKDYSDNEAVRPRGQEMVSTSEILIFFFFFFFDFLKKNLIFLCKFLC